MTFGFDPNNPTVMPQFFIPQNFILASITPANTINKTQTIVDTSQANDFVVGQQVRFHIPRGYGMTQLNELTGFVIAINSNIEFVVDTDTSQFNAFVIPGVPFNYQNAQVSAIGDRNISAPLNPNGAILNILTIPGAFQNIS